MVPEGLVLLDERRVRGRRRQARPKVNMLVQELPAVEGLARVDVALPRQDRHAHRRRHRRASRWRRSAVAQSRCEAALAALAAADPSPNATALALRGRSPRARVGTAPGACRSRPCGSGARSSSASTARGSSARPTSSSDRGRGRGRPRRRSGQVEEQATGRSGGWCCSPSHRQPLDGDSLPPTDPRRRRSCCSRTRSAPTPPRRSRYFAEQGVTLKVISGDNPRTVGAVAGALRHARADDPFDARDAARRSRGARRGARGVDRCSAA